MSKTIFIILSLCLLCVLLEGRRNGNQCYHKQKKMPGECKRRQNCPGTYEDLANGIKLEKCTRNTYCCARKIQNFSVRKPEVGKKSQEMCKKYESIAFVWQRANILLPGDVMEKTSICPWDYSSATVIYGGELAKQGEFPHMALIGYGKQEVKWGCGGSLVSSKYVLTAAHCLHLMNYGKPVRVRLGDLNITDISDDGHVQDIPIKITHKHPNYIFPRTYNDIAIFELEYEAKLNVYVKPICLYTEKELPEQVIATGWGYTENSSKRENDVLLKVGLDIYSGHNNRCLETFPKDKKYYPKGFINKSQICAGSAEKKDTCQGDSGGPIQIYNKQTECSYYIVGITSNGKDCGEKMPAVYVKIFPYIEWIESIIWS